MAAPRWLSSWLVRLSGNERAQRLLWSVMNLSSDLLGMGPGGFQISSGESILGGRLRQQFTLANRPLCIVDVGAHHGEFLDVIALPLAKQGIPVSVHAFEPDRRSFEQLHRHHGTSTYAILNNFALGRAPGEFDLHADAPGSPLASFSKRRLDHFDLTFEYSEKVRVQTLDEYCAEKNVDAIDLLKLDVEGHELDVMRGGLRMFRERRIRMLTFEFGGCNIDSRTYFQDYWYFMKDNHVGHIFRLTPSGFLAPVTAYNELFEQFRPTNYLVICDRS